MCRWRHIRRIASLFSAAAVCGLAWISASSGGSEVGAVSRSRSPLAVRTMNLTGSFSPQQMVSASGKIWLIGTVTSGRNSLSCAVEEVNPISLRRQLYPVPGCGPDVAVHGREIYLTDVAYVKHSNNEQIRIERFDTATKRAAVLAPLDMTLGGSSIAHTAMTYGAGSLWLWGYAIGTGNTVAQISPWTGAVVRTIIGVPNIGGIQPSMVVVGDGLWLAGGPGGSGTIERVTPTSSLPSVVYTAPAESTVQWVAASGTRVWAEIISFQDEGTKVTTMHLVALNANGPEAARVWPFSVTAAPASSNTLIWAVGNEGSSCETPLQLVRINGATGADQSVLTLRTTGAPCTAESAVTVSGQSVFAMVASSSTSTVLYRVTD